MENLNKELVELLEKVNIAKKDLISLSTDKKNLLLNKIADALILNKELIIKENIKDIDNAKQKGLKESLIERLTLNSSRIDNIANDVRNVAKLDDPVGELIEEKIRPNGLLIKKERTPFGVICVIYESRPNVTVDVSALCLKTSNACILRGGSEAINTNLILADIIRNSIKNYINPDIITVIKDTNRQIVNQLITAKEYIDLVIPRGGKGLIQNVVNNSHVPCIETGAGNCHLYINSDCNLDEAINISINAKVSRPSVCNAIETILVDEQIANIYLKKLKNEFDKYHVIIKGCPKTKQIVDVELATEDDYYEEYNDYIVAIKIVKDIDEAINHINKYSTKHSEAIVSNNNTYIERFLNEIDSACIYSNASTRFTDGSEFGLGAEIGISTQKMHARGPMGLKELTTYKYKIYGKGQVR